ncbi:uncharacterized protein BJ171DRAFT_614102 [Polychytrium aggregatum]|uniref:uncharacterized protein n=1 Tax=Polychytrium aggregatum TaxID=110093 RepID=UPI0022FE176F|nr:uncharacterized protein BJ171DRAFT_614102 [Polychytrium aggregatum]KAI9205971.1 hypothetical protein BJ171DRAFT_614102 [Polychytrium aggregatum]
MLPHASRWLLAWCLVASLYFRCADGWVQSVATLLGVGANAPAAVYSALANYYSTYDPYFNYAYTGIGSGAGRAALVAGSTNLTWAASDNVPSNVTFVGPGNIVGHSVAVIYHLNVTNLTLTRQNVADIFTGKVVYWNDTRLVQHNPALTSINARIQVIAISGSSGIASNFLYALNSIDPTLNLGNSLSYPLSTWGPATAAFYGSSNTIVSDGIQVTPYSIGFVDYPSASTTLASLASGLNLYAIANIINRNGDVVAPSIYTMSNALSTASTTNVSSLRHFSGDIGTYIRSTYIDTTTPNAYPFMEPSFILLRQDSQPYSIAEAQMRATLRFLFWMLFGGTETDPDFRRFAYDALKLVTQNGKVLFDASSPCNPYFDANGTYITANSCKHGYCVVDGPFQDSSVTQCICDAGFMNNMQLDCSEPSAPFMILFYGVESYNTAIMAFLSITGLINAAILAMLFVFREKPNIKAISPNCCYIIVVGALFGQIGALFYSAEPSTLVCSSRMFFPVIAFSSIFSMLLMKSVRIYMIFENRRMRVFKTPDWKLILATLVVLVAEIVVCAAWVAVEGPTAEVEGSFYGLVCTATFSSTVVPEIVLYVINGAIMLGCVAFAYLTRGAHERFQESKVIGICSYMVSLTLVLCLPIVYILSGSLDSQALFTVGRVILACLIVMISSFVPAALFAGRIIGVLRSDPGEGEKSGAPKSMHTSSGHSNIRSQGMLSADIITYVYDCGVQGLKFGGAWMSSTVLVFVTLDIIDFRDPSLDGTVQASFRFSACECEPCDSESDPEGGKALARSVKLRNNKSQLTLEFGSKETALTFLNNFKEAKAKPHIFKGKGIGALGDLGGQLGHSGHGLLGSLERGGTAMRRKSKTIVIHEPGDITASGTHDRIIASKIDESIDSQKS